MSTDEIFLYLCSLGFERTGDGHLERKLGPITLRATLSWPESRVALNGSYWDAHRMADTEGMLDRDVHDMVIHPTGLLPPNASEADVAERIAEILAELPELPIMVRLRHAITDGESEHVASMLSSGKLPPTTRMGPRRGSMLHFASTPGMVRQLAAAGVDANQGDRSGQTPLFAAINDAMADALLAAGASPTVRDHEGRTPLHRTLPVTVLKRLIAAGADVNARDGKGRTPIHYHVDLPGILFLLSAGAEIDAADHEGVRVLSIHLAADRLGHVGALLAYGADPEQVNSAGETAIFFARSLGALQLLLNDFHADPHARSQRGSTPLHGCEQAESVKLLCGRGVPAGVADSEGRTPLHLARTVGVVRALLAEGAAIDARDALGRTPLHYATRRADHHVVDELLACGGDPMPADRDGNTPLNFARTAHIAERLRAAGATGSAPTEAEAESAYRRVGN